MLWFRRYVLLDLDCVQSSQEVCRLIADTEQALRETPEPQPSDALALDMAWRMHAAAGRDRDRLEDKLNRRITMSLSLAGVVVAAMGAFQLPAGGFTISAVACLVLSAVVAAIPLSGGLGWPGQLSVVESMDAFRKTNRTDAWLAAHIDIFCTLTRLRINQVAGYLTASTLLAILGVTLLIGLVL